MPTEEGRPFGAAHIDRRASDADATHALKAGFVVGWASAKGSPPARRRGSEVAGLGVTPERVPTVASWGNDILGAVGSGMGAVRLSRCRFTVPIRGSLPRDSRAGDTRGALVKGTFAATDIPLTRARRLVSLPTKPETAAER